MRIAIVDDRILALEAVRRVVTSVPTNVVIWTARDGDDAVQKAAKEKPDLILMDLIMPGVNGAEATKRIMSSTPCPILIVTSSRSGNYGLVFDALGAGAIDAVNTPSLGLDGSLQGGQELLDKIAQVGKKLKTTSASGTYTPLSLPAVKTGLPLVAIGASTGGPQAIAEVLSQFPSTFSGAVLIVQHLGADFMTGLAEWIGHKSKIPVRVAVPGERPTAGVALLAGRNEHLVLRPDGTLAYTSYPSETPFRPNVDVMFDSLASHWTHPGYAVLLTGMGRDGAEGLLKLRKAAWTTYAQDKATSAVFGMPDAAAKLGGAIHVMPPPEIGRMILAQVKR